MTRTSTRRAPRWRAAAVLVAAGTLLVAACGSDDEPSVASTSSAAPGSQPEETRGAPATEPTATDPASESTPDEPPTKVVWVQPAASLGINEIVATYAVAHAEGFFEEENLDVSYVPSDGSSASIQAIAAGSADVGNPDPAAAIAAAQQGVGVSIFGGLIQHWQYQLAVMPDGDMQTAADLGGKKVGVISLGSGSAAFVTALAADNGVAADDFEMIAVGVGAPAVAALESGEVDAIALYKAAYTAIENTGVEFRYLENSPRFDDLFGLSYVGSTEFVESGVAERFGRAMYKAILFSAANPEAALNHGYDVLPDLIPPGSSREERFDEDLEALEVWIASATPAEGTPDSWGDWGVITDDQWAKYLDFAAETGIVVGEVDLDAVWTDELIPGMNDWDRAPVLDRAAGAS